jgi:uncharacterized membrane protein YqjE
MGAIVKFFNKVFDFFCGDWIVFFGMCITILVIEIINKTFSLESLGAISGVLFVLGIAISFIIAIKREVSKQ